ncbi:MAG: WXG100 family type VII secretion target [Segniliparus sp.]|uniref:WXG100 family type VII secretion target n=1 Tax=Segniliparus sp. TaxID=2804064 RepID=UPI003F4050E0
MGQKDFPPTARSDWGQNIGIGGSLKPELVEQASKKWGQLGEDIAQDLSDFYQSVAGGQHEWRGKGFDAFYGEAGRVYESGRDHGKTSMDTYAQTLADHSSDTAQAKSTVANNSSCEWGQDDGPAAEAAANALQAMYRPPGENAFQEIPDFQSPSAVDGSGLGGGGPSGAGGSGGGSGGGASGGGAPSGDAGGTADRNPSVGSGGDGEYAPRSYSGDGGQGSSGDDKGGAQGGSPSGGEGAGGGSPSGQGGGPAGGGPPPGGPSPSTGAQGSPFDSSAYDPSSPAGLSGGIDSSGAGGGFVGGVGGGFGGGDRERTLSQKPSAVAARGTEVRISAPKVPNLPSGMGAMPGGGMAPGAAGKRDDKERKTPSYLVNAEHGQAMLGDALPIVNAPVMGELTKAELQEMQEASKGQSPEKEQPAKAKSGAAPPPPPPGAPTARGKAGQP